MQMLRRALVGIASLWWTMLWLTVTLLVAVARLAADDDAIGTWVVVPCVGMCVNLLAALVVNERLRRQGGLLVFHLGLAVLAALLALGQAVRLVGEVEVAQGTGFAPDQVTARMGRWHQPDLSSILFVQGPVEAEYRGELRTSYNSLVYVPVEDGWGEAEIVRGRPLLLDGYRFSMTQNKGFAPVLRYTDAAGQSSSGAVHMPAFPTNHDKQANDVELPGGGPSVVLWLNLPPDYYDPEGEWVFGRLPEAATVTVDDGTRQHLLKPGESVPVGEGHVAYEGLTVWMGYEIYYDPTLPWLIAASVVAALGLAWHATARLARFVEAEGLANA